MAMMRPNLKPLNTVWAKRSLNGVPLGASPTANTTARASPASTVASTVASWPSRSLMPSGSVVVSMLTW